MLWRLAMEMISRLRKVKCFNDRPDQQLDCFDENPDLDDVMSDDDFTEEVQMQSKKSKGHYLSPYLPTFRQGDNWSQELETSLSHKVARRRFGCILCGNKFIAIFVEHLSGSQTMIVSVSSLNGIWMVVSCCTILPKNFQKYIHFCILLPKWDRTTTYIWQQSWACFYTWIDSNWHTEEQSKSITFPKFPGESSYIENILADNNDEMEGPDKIWYWCIIYSAFM